mgnify:CR=1 FL=1
MEKVVIPLQTKGFYNALVYLGDSLGNVVIPLQTKGFYNYRYPIRGTWSEELSYLSKRKDSTTRIELAEIQGKCKLSYLSKRKDSTTL